MSPLSRPITLRSARSLFCAALALGLAAPAFGQPADRWGSTEDHYDAAAVEAQLETWRDLMSRRHGPLAEAWFEMHEALLPAPHDLVQRPVAPSVPRLRHQIEAAHLLHFQAVAGGGTLGALHGTVTHPLGLAWFPHSMFAQGGRLYGQWGFARVLAGVRSHVERHAD